MKNKIKIFLDDVYSVNRSAEEFINKNPNYFVKKIYSSYVDGKTHLMILLEKIDGGVDN